jgi:ABC-type phosphate transport system auxiliary subunit
MPTALDTKLPDLLTALQIKVVNRDLYYQDFTHSVLLSK